MAEADPTQVLIPGVPPVHPGAYADLADLCRLGREAFLTASAAAFHATPGSEAQACAEAAVDPSWPNGPWPNQDPTQPLHQVGLMLSNSAAGRLGEMAVLLDSGEVHWSLPTHARGILEICARLFRIYVQPFLCTAYMRPLMPYTAPVPPAAINAMYAAAHVEIFNGAFSALTLADKTLELNPTDQDRIDHVTHVQAELSRLRGAYEPLYDPATNDTTKAAKLKLGGIHEPTKTAVVDAVAAWMWPDQATRPAPIYRVFSGHAHSSLDADRMLYDEEEIGGLRKMTRRITPDFVSNTAVMPLMVFQRTLARLVGFYGWDETSLHEYSEALAKTCPTYFTYT